MSESLKDKAYRGVLWSAIDAGSARVVQFVIGVILARLLLPEQFGLIGMLTIFMAIGQSFLMSGFASALVQKREVTPIDTSSVFYFNVVLGGILAVLLSLAAPWIAAFYAQPALVSLTRAMSLLFVINSFAVVQTAMLTRSVDFKSQAKINLLATIVSGVVGVILAVSGLGVWSLVGQQLTDTLFRSSLLWLYSEWRPVLGFSCLALREMFVFGSRILFSGLMNQAFDSVYYVVIGKLFSPATLGFYSRAIRIEELPVQTLTQVITRVSFPVFAATRQDTLRLKAGLRKALSGLAFLNCPVMIGLAVTADPLVRVLLTEKWLPCVPYLQLLSIVGLFVPMHALNLNTLQALGRSDLFLYVEIIKKILAVISILFTWRWGVTAMIVGQLIISIPNYYLSSYFVVRLVGYRVKQQLRDVTPYFGGAIIMGAAVHAWQYMALHNTLLLAIQVLWGIVSYSLFCYILRLPAFQECVRILRGRLHIGQWGKVQA